MEWFVLAAGFIGGVEFTRGCYEASWFDLCLGAFLVLVALARLLGTWAT